MRDERTPQATAVPQRRSSGLATNSSKFCTGRYPCTTEGRVLRRRRSSLPSTRTLDQLPRAPSATTGTPAAFNSASRGPPPRRTITSTSIPLDFSREASRTSCLSAPPIHRSPMRKDMRTTIRYRAEAGCQMMCWCWSHSRFGKSKPGCNFSAAFL